MKIVEKPIKRQLISINKLRPGNAFRDLDGNLCILVNLIDNKRCQVVVLSTDKKSTEITGKNTNDVVERVSLLEVDYQPWPMPLKNQEIKNENTARM